MVVLVGEVGRGAHEGARGSRRNPMLSKQMETLLHTRYRVAAALEHVGGLGECAAGVARSAFATLPRSLVLDSHKVVGWQVLFCALPLRFEDVIGEGSLRWSEIGRGSVRCRTEESW